MAKPSPLPPVIVNPPFSVTQKFSFLGQICQVSHYYRTLNAPIGTISGQEAELAALWVVNPLSALQDAVSVNTILFENRIYCLTHPDVATLVTPTATAAGHRAGEPLPPQIAQVLSKVTAYRGRHARGRMYIGGMSETDSTNGVPTPAFTIIAQAACTVLKNDLGPGTLGNTYRPVVVALSTLVNNGTPDAPLWTVRGADITNMTADLIWNTQRRRTIGRGS